MELEFDYGMINKSNSVYFSADDKTTEEKPTLDRKGYIDLVNALNAEKKLDEAKAKIEEWNKDHKDDPITESDITKAVEDVAKTEAKEEVKDDAKTTEDKPAETKDEEKTEEHSADKRVEDKDDTTLDTEKCAEYLKKNFSEEDIEYMIKNFSDADWHEIFDNTNFSADAWEPTTEESVRLFSIGSALKTAVFSALDGITEDTNFSAINNNELVVNFSEALTNNVNFSEGNTQDAAIEILSYYFSQNDLDNLADYTEHYAKFFSENYTVDELKEFSTLSEYDWIDAYFSAQDEDDESKEVDESEDDKVCPECGKDPCECKKDEDKKSE